MPATFLTPSPAQKKQQQNTQQQIQNLQKQGWGEFGEQQPEQIHTENGQNTLDNSNVFLTTPPRAEDIKIEIPLFVRAKPEDAVQLLKEEAGYLEKRVDYDLAEVLEAKQAIALSNEFSAFGSMPINAETLAVAETERIMSDHKEGFEQEQAAAVEEAERIISEESDQIGTSENLNIGRLEIQAEPLVEDKHTEEPKVFRNDVDLVRHHSDVDFPYFFGWLGGQFEGISKPFGKTVLNTRQWVDTKTALFDDLLFKQVFGWGQKKELSKEEKERQQTQAANKRTFFESLKTEAAKVAGSQRKGSLKSRLEALNRNLKRGNLSYEGDLDETGQIRESVLIDEEKANSEKTEEQLKAEKKKKLMWAGRSAVKKGPGISMTADKAHNFNNAAKLAG